MAPAAIGRVAVTAGRGKTGRAVIAALSAAGHVTRVLGQAELRDPRAALAGCTEAYLIAPNMHPEEPEYIAGLLAAAHAARVQRIVYHSVAAPYLPEVPHHLGKAEAERLVRASGLDWTILQPCAYVQNFLPALAQGDPALTVPYDPTRRFSLVDLNDVGEAAARVLEDDRLIGATVELGGPAHVTVDDLGRVASEVLGGPVPVTRIGAAEWAAGPGANLEPTERDWLLAMFAHYDAHGLLAGALATAALLEREPTTVREVLDRELLGRNCR